LPAQVGKQFSPNPLIPVPCADVGMSDECHVLHILYPHHADQAAALLVSPELDTSGDFTSKLIPGHVRLSPEVSRNYARIRPSGVVDDLVYDF